MNNSFEFDKDFNVTINPQIATLSPFKAIFDKYKDKELAVAEISFIVYLLHYKVLMFENLYH